MAATGRELELQCIRALRGNPNTLERKYMTLYDEKTKLDFIVCEYEQQAKERDKDVISYRKKYNDSKDEIAGLNRVISAYEDKLQETALSFEQLREQHRDAVSRYQKRDGDYRELELKYMELQRGFEDLEKQLAERDRAFSELEERSNTAFTAGQELQKKYDHVVEVNRFLEGENADLKKENLKFRGQVANDKRNMFGSKSEKTENIVNGQPVQEDPIAEDAPAEEAATENDGGKVIDFKKKTASAKSATEEIEDRVNGGKKKPRNGGNSKNDPYEKFKDLRQTYRFERDDAKNADPRFRFTRYDDHWEVMETRPTLYVQHTLTPVYEERMENGERKLISIPLRVNPYPGSYISSGLLSRVANEKFVRGVALYGMEEEYKRRGISLARQILSRGLIHFSEGVLKELCDHLGIELDERFIVQHMDETWLTQALWSIEDKLNGKKNGAKGLIWARISGELSDGPQIMLFTYSKTRSTEFLKKVLKSYAGYLCSDAYAAYFAMEKLNPKMRIAVCWMHCRRNFARAVMVSDKALKMWDGKTEEEVLEQPAVKALLTLNRVFEADTELKRKKLSVDEMYEQRQEKVAPIVKEFFDYIHGIDLKGEGMFEELRQAIGYALNQEDALKVFLEDGEIPIDNGHCERQIKHVAKVRKSCLFAYSEDGAEAFGRYMSVLWTAIANGADPYYYLKFIIEEYAKLEQAGFPKDMKSWFAERMPWSPLYIDHERRQRENHVDEFVPESELPREGERIRFKGEPPKEFLKFATLGRVVA